MKRILSIFILLALVLTSVLAFTSCKKETGKKTDETNANDSKETVTGGEEVTTEGEATLDLPDVDYDGKEFRILAISPESYTTELYVTEEVANSGTQVDAAVYRRLVTIEADYKVEFKMGSVSARKDVDTWMTVTSLSASLDDTYHVVANSGRSTQAYVVNGLCGDWTNLKYVNLDADWWSQGAKEQWVMPSGSIYMMMGSISNGSVGQATVMYFDKDVLRNADISYPYDLVRDGEWTLEKFREMVVEADASLTGDDSGSLDSDSFGYVTGAGKGPCNIINSLGYHWIIIEDGNYSIISKNAPNLEQAFSDYFSLLNDTGACLCRLDATTPTTEMIAAMEGGRVAFMDNRLEYSDNMSKKGINFGVVPWPNYLSGSTEYHTFVNPAANTFVIPNLVANDKETSDFASLVLEAMAYYGHTDVLPTYYNTILTYQSQTDVDSVEMVGIIQAGLSFDLSCYYVCNGMFDIGMKMANNNNNFVTEYDSRIDGAQAKLDIWLNVD